VPVHHAAPAQTDTTPADVATDASTATDGTTTEQPASLTDGGWLLRQIHQFGLADIGADAEIDVIASGTLLAAIGSSRGEPFRRPVSRGR
jgi:hypothetical protein